MMWMHMLADYWEFSGDEAGLRVVRPALRRLLSFVSEQADEMGLLPNWPAGQFWEWAPITGSAEACLLITNAFLCRAQERLLTVPVLADLFPGDADKRLSRRREVLHDLFWVPERGLYRDALPEEPARYAQSVNASAVWAGIAPPELRREVLGRIVDPVELGPVPTGESTPEKEPDYPQRAVIPCGTLLMANFVVEALFAEGMDAEALRAVRHFWGAYDALPTFPETRVQGHNTGFCHGWAGGPGYLLPRYLLGVRPVAGWGRVAFQPHVGEENGAQGCFQTPFGELSAEWERTGEGEVVARLAVPDGMEVGIAATGEKVTGPAELVRSLSA
jgi:hypothetical protein